MGTGGATGGTPDVRHRGRMAREPVSVWSCRVQKVHWFHALYATPEDAPEAVRQRGGVPGSIVDA